ncbi:acetolactate decarboxylase [Lewinella cohaerens]|uniref:acetolactate decarboxylase n=1 Tax=Lewinella cohaerens TaxID=70995 RepID=UPI00036B861E|nr:acetolactate decarboxylase [Lewinella cohaerens]
MNNRLTTPTLLVLLNLGFLSCGVGEATAITHDAYPDVQVAGAMKNVMWKGELAGIISLEDIANKEGLYGIGPLSYLQGELLINDGQAYVSKVVSDTTMMVKATFDTEAPFLVYGNVTEWQELELPASITNGKALESHLDTLTRSYKRPFVFKLKGEVMSADIHIQNLPEGSKVSSPEEAHRGQTNYALGQEQVAIIGFFSTEHQGIFTHHDSYIHLHLITDDNTQMGHLDAVEFEAEKMKLYLPVK